MSETALRTASPAARPGPARDGGPAALDAFLAPEVRRAIEETWSARINEQASLAAALADPSFLEAPSRHVALYADHGVVHARDVALMLLQVLDTANGRLIPARAPDRLGWMKAYGVLLACLHDIGMADCSPVGRAMHPEFATQVVLGPEFDGILRRLRDDAGGIAARIVRLGRAGALGGRAPEAVLREALALANCHSKSKVPTALLNDPGALRRAMLAAAAAEVPARAGRPGPLHADFAWLEMATGPGRELVEDVIDTLRALRCADALRQRGTGAEDLGRLRDLRRRTLGQRRLRPASGPGAPLLPRGARAGRRRRGEPRQQPARRRRRPARLLPPRRVPRPRDGAQGGAERGAGGGGHPGRRDRQLRAERRRRASRPAAAGGHPHPDRVGRGEPGLRPAGARGARPPRSGGGGAGAHRRLPRSGVGGGAEPLSPQRRPRLGPRTPAGGAAADRPLRLPDPRRSTRRWRSARCGRSRSVRARR